MSWSRSSGCNTGGGDICAAHSCCTVGIGCRESVADAVVFASVVRYGLRESDSPWLWARMRAYVQAMASVFHGFRIDNAHGTPIHVAAAMLDAAREVR